MGKTYLVTNRSASRIYYAVPELGIKSRMFQPGETKKISYEELEALNYQPGGNTLIKNYLLLQDANIKEEFCGKTEPEYNMTAADVKELILHGSMDEWLDCLDFAPEGVIDLIKELSIELPLTDTRKMDSYMKKTGTNLGKLIQIRAEERAEEEAAKQAAEENKERRTQKPAATAPAEPEPTTRRTSGSKYNIVKKAEV